MFIFTPDNCKGVTHTPEQSLQAMTLKLTLILKHWVNHCTWDNKTVYLPDAFSNSQNVFLAFKINTFHAVNQKHKGMIIYASITHSQDSERSID